MSPSPKFAINEAEVPGDRLNRILDHVGFRRVRGRSSDFYDFLVENSPDDWELKESTVRSWFSKSAPTMKKIIEIVNILDKHYGFEGNAELKSIQAWWKVGGSDPFIGPNESKNVREEETKKLDFLLPSIIVDEVGEDFQNIPAKDLEDLQNQTLSFLIDFGNPNIKSCPDEYIRMAINYFYKDIKNKQGK